MEFELGSTIPGDPMVTDSFGFSFLDEDTKNDPIQGQEAQLDFVENGSQPYGVSGADKRESLDSDHQDNIDQVLGIVVDVSEASSPSQTALSPNNSSSSGPVSPDSSFPGSSMISATILHKPRGSGGKWQPVTSGQRIRVTSKLGKVLRILVQTTVDCDWNTLQIQLLEKTQADGTWTQADPSSSFSLDSKKVFRENSTFSMQLELKLFLLYRSLVFLIQVTTLDGTPLGTQTVEIITHNSGITDQSKKKADASNDTLADDLPDTIRPSKKRTLASPGSDQSSFSSITVDPMQQNIALAREDNVPPGWQYQAGNLQVEGAVRARAFIQYSDIRLKTNIEDLVDAMAIISSLQGKSYEWNPEVLPTKERSNDPEGRGRRVIGLIAQEVQRVLPQVVHETADGLLSVNYAEIIPLLIEAFKQHSKQTEAAQEGIQKEISELKDAVAKLQMQPERDIVTEFRALRPRISTMTLRLGQHVQNHNEPEATSSDSESETTSGSDSSSSSSSNLDTNTSHMVEMMQPAAHNGVEQTKPLIRASKGSKDRSSRSKQTQKSMDNHSTKQQTASATTSKDPEDPSSGPSPASTSKNESPWKRSCRIFTFIILGVVLLTSIAVGIFFGVRASRGGNNPPNSPTAARDINWLSNVVNNPGFETVGGTPQRASVWQGDYSIVSSTALELNTAPPFDAGRWVLKLTANGTLESGLAGTLASQVQNFNSVNVTGVNCSFWAHVSFAGGSVNASTGFAPRAYLILIVRFADARIADATYILEAHLNSGSGWRFSSRIFRLPSALVQGATIAVVHENLSGRTYWDNVYCIYTQDEIPP